MSISKRTDKLVYPENGILLRWVENMKIVILSESLTHKRAHTVLFNLHEILQQAK